MTLADLPQDRLAAVEKDIADLIDAALTGERRDDTMEIRAIDQLVGGIADAPGRSQLALRLITPPGTRENPGVWCARFLLEPERGVLRTALAEGDLTSFSTAPAWAVRVLGKIGDAACEGVLRDQREQVSKRAAGVADPVERSGWNVLFEEYDRALTWIDLQKKPETLLGWAFGAGAPRKELAQAWAMARAVDLGVPRAEVRRVVLEYLNALPRGRIGGESVKLVAVRLGLITPEEAPSVLEVGVVE